MKKVFIPLFSILVLMVTHEKLMAQTTPTTTTTTTLTVKGIPYKNPDVTWEAQKTADSLAAVAALATIKVMDTQISYDDKMRASLSANIDPEASTVKKAWANYLSKNHKVRLRGAGIFSSTDL